MATNPVSAEPPAPRRGLNRQITRLAIPAFGTLIAEPLFLIADTAIVGYLGVLELAGVGLAATLLQTAVGLMVFLAYSTTAAVARLLGAGRHAAAIAAGRDGIWLGAAWGIALAISGWFATEPLLRLLGASDAVLGHATTYLQISLLGLPAMLLVFAATGLLRGLQDTRTPLFIAVIGFTLNAGLNWVLVYPAGLGVAGSALGTIAVQWLMAAAYFFIVLRGLRAQGLALAPSWRGLRALSSAGGWLLLRTATLRAAILLTILVATAQGPINLAAHHITMTLFTLLAFALDAIAIAAQALIGKELGAARVEQVAELTRRMLLWGFGFGIVTGALMLLASRWLGWLFSPDPQVHAALSGALLGLALGQPLAGLVFVLDGVLIGAGDSRYLALAGVLCLLAYLPLLFWVAATTGAQSGLEPAQALGWLWLAFGVGYMLARAITLGVRIRGTAWQRTGAGLPGEEF
ncbi:MATE family efflux transporter [Acaricomes phytoseiuli]|uniref:MATE family efflux transporter n=1 Tax=Acaricomes phytoseiuli TaxID=291968 RepID=UPI00222147D0|nr:MATE family efflux transporter [Acaricomes phytoseiuli]MCW1248633.1 MATE family efflux transporter [Acaricomes phytoseiuli]